MATVEVRHPRPVEPQILAEVPNMEREVKEDLKASLKNRSAAEDESEEQILFSCNICYEVCAEYNITYLYLRDCFTFSGEKFGHCSCVPCLNLRLTSICATIFAGCI